MSLVHLRERDLTPAEFERMKQGFDEHTREHGVAIQQSDRFGFVAVREDAFVGCSSGLAYRNGAVYSGWFYLTDLFVEKPFRSQGLGASLLRALEDRVAALGVRTMWTWTAGYEAEGFYRKQGYDVFAELEGWYSDGSSRIGLRKTLG